MFPLSGSALSFRTDYSYSHRHYDFLRLALDGRGLVLLPKHWQENSRLPNRTITRPFGLICGLLLRLTACRLFVFFAGTSILVIESSQHCWWYFVCTASIWDRWHSYVQRIDDCYCMTFLKMYFISLCNQCFLANSKIFIIVPSSSVLPYF